jgi:hypothetical protein
MRLVRLALGLLLVAASHASAEVTRVSISSQARVANGQAFGAAGPYEKLIGTIELALDPADPHNAGIADLDLAPRRADGRVHFSADLYVLRPVDQSKGNGTLLFEISNRGGKGLLSRFNRAPRLSDPAQPADFGDGFLMREGYTLVWVGWEFDVASGLHVDAPRARLPDGGSVTVRFTVDATTNDTQLRDAPRYPPLRLNDPDATLTVRDRFWDRPVPLPRKRWHFTGGTMRRIALAGGFEPGRIYEVTYTASGARVAGVGLAAIRDAASAFLHRSDLPVRGTRALVFGISQSGRFLRQFLHDGFNVDERNRRVFDAGWAHVAGAAQGSFNERFAMPTSLSAFVGTRPPFMIGGEPRDFRLKAEASAKAEATRSKIQPPKIFYTNTSVEYWGNGRAAALTHTTEDGKSDAVLPEHVRIYLFSGTQHGEAPFPPPTTTGQQPSNPTPQAAVMRALLRSLHQWVRDRVPPPESRYPRLGDGSLTPVSRLRFPPIPAVPDPRTITGPALGTPGGSVQMLPFLVPQVDVDGNEIAGIRVPEVSVPLSTTTGWNFRSAAVGNPGDIYSLLGSAIAFWPTKAEREAHNDPRQSIEERYPSREIYLRRIREDALELVRGRYLLDEDLDDVLTRAAAYWDFATKAARGSGF